MYAPLRHLGPRHRSGRSDTLRLSLDAAAREQAKELADCSTNHNAVSEVIDVEAKIADLTVIADTLRAALSAGCDDLATCAGIPDCPIPFTDLAARSADSRAGRL